MILVSAQFHPSNDFEVFGFAEKIFFLCVKIEDAVQKYRKNVVKILYLKYFDINNLSEGEGFNISPLFYIQISTLTFFICCLLLFFEF